jgi:hypothetical protein
MTLPAVADLADAVMLPSRLVVASSARGNRVRSIAPARLVSSREARAGIGNRGALAIAHSTVNAAALQDHLVRTMNLSSILSTKSSVRHGGAKALKRPVPRSARQGGKYVEQWECDECGKLNDATASECGACESERPSQHSVRAPRPTLAQSRGLVPGARARLSDADWEALEGDVVRRGAVEEPCSICLDPLGMREQVLLSCGHLFHRACLDSFERFQRSTHGAETLKKCPFCRSVGYEKRRTRLAASAKIRECVVTIQSYWRGFRTRKTYLKLRREWYDAGHGEGGLARRAFFRRELEAVSQRLRLAVRRSELRTQSLMRQLDSESAAAREALTMALDSATLAISSKEWSSIESRVAKRGAEHDDCPICLEALGQQDISVLSCGHLLHSACIASFERFQVQDGRARMCPVCKHENYQRRPWKTPPATEEAPASVTDAALASVSDAAPVSVSDKVSRRRDELKALLASFESSLDRFDVESSKRDVLLTGGTSVTELIRRRHGY